MKAFKIIGVVGLLLSFAIPAWPADYTIKDKNYRTEGYVNSGKIYNRNYKIEGYVTKDGTIRDRDYRIKGYVDKNNSGRNGCNSGRRK